MKKYIKKLLLLGILAIGNLLAACSAEDTRSVTMVGYNYTERPIFTFSVNGVGGSNLFVNSGGAKMSCCTIVTVGKEAEIEWTYSRTKKQYEAGVQIEHHSKKAFLPPPQAPDASYLEVHFYPDHHVELALVAFPGKRRLPRLPEDDQP